MINLFGIIAVMSHFQKFMMQTWKHESTQLLKRKSRLYIDDI